MRRRDCIDLLVVELGVSERRACETLGQHRSTRRKKPRGRFDEESAEALLDRILENGALPLAAMREHVEAWIEEEAKETMKK